MIGVRPQYDTPRIGWKNQDEGGKMDKDVMLRKIESALNKVTHEEKEQLWGKALIPSIEAWLRNYFSSLGLRRFLSYLEAVEKGALGVASSYESDPAQLKRDLEDPELNVRILQTDHWSVIVGCFSSCKEENGLEELTPEKAAFIARKIGELAGFIRQQVRREVCL
jgi:hypothetical protein